MAKIKTVFVCQECGYETPRWMGRCPSCNKWNTFVEEVHNEGTLSGKAGKGAAVLKPVALNELRVSHEERYSTGIREMDRVLGGGLVKGSLVLVGGDPGIGKSTLLLQVCDRFERGRRIFYFSGEESVNQIKMRADRLSVTNPDLYLIAETNFDLIQATIEAEKPSLVVIDSIQTMYREGISSAPGSISQVREVTLGLMQTAKSLGISVFIVGHVTKEGAIAGPRVLEHMVDTVLYLEGERYLVYRILRAVKNRFGSTNEIGIFEMKEDGLEEVNNPSAALLSGRPRDVPGTAIVSSIEGTRSMLLEIQALVSPTNFGMPRRMTTGVDYNRATMLMAVLEKRAGMALSNQDAYINVAGGIKIDEPSADLGIAMAIASSFRNRQLDNDMVFIGEIGLTGEVRTVSHIDKRVNEAVRSGFAKCMVPEGNAAFLGERKDIQIIGVSSILKALEWAFGAMQDKG